jgi:hypothetical protein
MELATLFLQAEPLPSSEDGFGWPLAIFLIGFFTCIAAVVVVVIWQSMVTYRARMSIARESAYRQLADDSVRAQERTADRLDRAVSELTDLRQRTAELERMLKEVG